MVVGKKVVYKMDVGTIVVDKMALGKLVIDKMLWHNCRQNNRWYNGN
jgi:hypothetical protein